LLSSASLLTKPLANDAPSVASSAALPASLEKLYPPKAPRPVFLMAMLELNAALTGIAVDVGENDPDGTAANLQRFQERYRHAAELVPEWASRYPTEPVDDLAKVIASGSVEEVFAAVGKVGAVCHECHTATMVPVQLQYHWPDFRSVMVEDPITKHDIDYPSFMQMLNVGLTGVGVDTEQGQPENARAQLAAFRSRMTALKESCDACHDTPRSYFVDDRIDALMTDLAAALEAAAPDPSRVAALNRRIGEESCSQCHMVHLPAAYSRSLSH